MKRLLFVVSLIMAVQFAGAQEAPEGLFIASKAPDFKAKDQNGKEVRLKDLLKQGKVVLVFYRGYWCPYCNKELSRLQDSLQLIKDKGATLIAISPEKPENITGPVIMRSSRKRKLKVISFSIFPAHLVFSCNRVQRNGR